MSIPTDLQWHSFFLLLHRLVGFFLHFNSLVYVYLGKNISDFFPEAGRNQLCVCSIEEFC